MIRAIVRGGLIHPLDPLPAEWQEGQKITLTGKVIAEPDAEEAQRWYQDMAKLTAKLKDPNEWCRFEEALAEQKRISKEQMRKEMGLSE
jgi:hypothetical protein